MKKLLPVCLLAFAATACLAQDKAAIEKGQKYLDKVARAVIAKSPQTLLLAVYRGDKNVGHMKYTVKSVEGGFEVTGEADMAVDEKKVKMHVEAKCGPNLCPISGTKVDGGTDPGDNSTERFEVADGKWKVTREQAGKTETKEGVVTAGTAIEPPFLFAFIAPEDAEFALAEIEMEGTKFSVYKKLDAKESVQVDGKAIECWVLEETSGEEKSHLLFSAEGALVEEQFVGGPMRMRPATEADLGKDLAGSGKLSGPAQAIIDFYRAIKRNDEKAIKASFDFERMAKEQVPGYADATEQVQQEAVEGLEKGFMGQMTSAELRSKLPEEDLIAAAIGPDIKVTENGDGTAIVEVQDEVWKLYQKTDGDRKGAWVVYSVQPK